MWGIYYSGYLYVMIQWYINKIVCVHLRHELHNHYTDSTLDRSFPRGFIIVRTASRPITIFRVLQRFNFHSEVTARYFSLLISVEWKLSSFITSDGNNLYSTRVCFFIFLYFWETFSTFRKLLCGLDDKRLLILLLYHRLWTYSFRESLQEHRIYVH